MSTNKAQNLSQILDVGVIAVIRGTSQEQLLAVSQALLAGGVTALEVTMTTPKAIRLIEALTDTAGDRAVIGVGTVLDPGSCQAAIHAGAQFVVSPMFDPEIVATTLRYGKISIPGSFTPTEILRCWSAGADVVKVFPSTKLGPGYFRDVLAPLPQLRLMPTGGVDLQNVGEWIASGAACVGVASALMSSDHLAKQDWEAITRSANAFVRTIRQAKGGDHRG